MKFALCCFVLGWTSPTGFWLRVLSLKVQTNAEISNKSIVSMEDVGFNLKRLKLIYSSNNLSTGIVQLNHISIIL